MVFCRHLYKKAWYKLKQENNLNKNEENLLAIFSLWYCYCEAALALAVKKNDFPLIKLLLKNGAEMKVSGEAEQALVNEARKSLAMDGIIEQLEAHMKICYEQSKYRLDFWNENNHFYRNDYIEVGNKLLTILKHPELEVNFNQTDFKILGQDKLGEITDQMDEKNMLPLVIQQIKNRQPVEHLGKRQR